MRHWQKVMQVVGIVPSLREGYAMDYLEDRGLRFCIHFGRANAEEKAAAIYVKEAEAQFHPSGWRRTWR